MHQKEYKHLCRKDRDVIYRMFQEGKPQTEIARTIGFSQSTVSKEISRNRGLKGYRPRQAQALADQRKECKATRTPVITGELEKQVVERLYDKQTPMMISGALGFEECSVSHETIYQYIAADKAAGGMLHKQLPINGKRRYRRRCKAARTKIPNRTGIESRPQIVDQRKRYGDWEVDLIEGTKGSGYLLSLYERKSRVGLLHKLETKTATETAWAIILKLSGFKVKTITYDNGLEFAQHELITRELGAKGYFCQPYHSWEKGGVENYNRNVRRIFPKGSDFSELNSYEITAAQEQINNWPKEVLGYQTPSQQKHKIAA